MRSRSFTLSVSSIFLEALLVNAEQPKFEEASVRLAHQCVLQNTVDPGMIAFHGDPLNVILMTAFGVKIDQITGPSWLESECVSIDAKMPDGSTKDQLPAMLLALVSERFQLAAHKETKLRTGYALVVDQKGPKFKEAALDLPENRAHPGVAFGVGVGLIKGSMTMAFLARYVSGRLDAPVEDLTGLQGKYEIDVSWAPDWSVENRGRFAQAAEANPGSTDTAASLPTVPKDDIFAAFRNTLGLRLESRKLPVEVIVIDHIERIPAPN